MNVLIDTNIIIDYVLRREPFVGASSKALEQSVVGGVKAHLTASTITDIYYLTRRTLSDSSAAKEVITKLLNMFNIISVDRNDCLKALDTDMTDYEDSLLSVCAAKVKARYIITRNTKDFASSKVKAITPEEFIKL